MDKYWFLEVHRLPTWAKFWLIISMFLLVTTILEPQRIIELPTLIRVPILVSDLYACGCILAVLIWNLIDSWLYIKKEKP